jgi:hypothetical protein
LTMAAAINTSGAEPVDRKMPPRLKLSAPSFRKAFRMPVG